MIDIIIFIALAGNGFVLYELTRAVKELHKRKPLVPVVRCTCEEAYQKVSAKLDTRKEGLVKGPASDVNCDCCNRKVVRWEPIDGEKICVNCLRERELGNG
jgi:hypothetical protein